MNSRERFRCYLNEEEEISLKQKLQESIRIFFEFSRPIHKKKEDKKTDYNSSSGEQDKSSYQKEQSYQSDKKK